MYVSKQTIEDINFLASAKYQNFTHEFTDTGVTADENGRKIIPAGTVYPSNDANAEGIVFRNVDVTHGKAAGALMVEGWVLLERLQQDVTVEAADAMHSIKFKGTQPTATTGTTA